MDQISCHTDYQYSFGMITDIQYADIPNGQNYSKTRWRYYRNALKILRSAVDFWNNSQSRPFFVIQLGDLIDRHNAIYDITESGLESVMREFRKLPCKTYHLWGNHEFYNFSRQQLEKKELNSYYESCDTATPLTENGEGLKKEISSLVAGCNRISCSPTPNQEVFKVEGNYYFKFSPHPNYLFVSLDGYDVSLIGRKKGSSKYLQAVDMITKVNKNQDLNSPEGLHGFDCRFVMFNGAFSEQQLDWLDRSLQKASKDNQRVIILSHIPLHPNCCTPICLAWNYQAVLDVLWKYNCVEACFYGHDHDGGYCVDSHNIHHRTFEGAIEAGPGLECFATVHCTNTGLIINGKGTIKQQFMPFKKKFSLVVGE